jgi:hypothetical protein
MENQTEESSLFDWFTSSEPPVAEVVNTPEEDAWEEVNNTVVPEVNPMIGGIMKAHSNRMEVDYEDSTENALRFATFVGLVENSGQTYGANVPEEGKEQSSAQGLYQFLDDDSQGQSAWQTGLNRTKKYLGPQKWIGDSYEYGKGGVNLATRNQQTAVFLADLLEQKGSDALMKPILEGNVDGWVEAYLKLHYKGKPTPATLKHAEEVYKSMNLKVRF